MLKIPYEKVIEKIKAQTGISDAELETKIKKKIDQLSGLISKDGAAHIVANELGVKVMPSGLLKVTDIVPGLRSVETQGKVLRKFEVRSFDTGKRKGTVGSFILADETGKIRVTLWHDQTQLLAKLKENDVVKIIDAYVRENQGGLELHLNDRSRCLVNPENVVINSVQDALTTQRKSIADLTDTDMQVEVFGTIVQVFDIRFFEVCPTCNKRLKGREQGFVCDEHNAVSPAYSYVLNAYVDDGSGNMRCIFFRNQVHNLLKMSEQDVLSYRQSLPAFEKIKMDLLGEQIKVIGRCQRNTVFDRLEFVAQQVFRDINPEEELQRLQQAKPVEAVNG